MCSALCHSERRFSAVGRRAAVTGAREMTERDDHMRLVLILSVSVALGVGLLLVGIGPVVAQAPDPALEEKMYQIADQLNCPICQGQRLSECPIQVCQEMRAEIVQRLREGQQESEIIQAFVDRYGKQVLNQPPAEGFHLLAWVIPFIGLAAVLVTGGWVLRMWLRRRPAAVPVDVSGGFASDLPEEYVRQLEEELKDRL